jgi:hypothetical protein
VVLGNCVKGRGRKRVLRPVALRRVLAEATNQWISLITVIATPIHPAIYTTLMTIPAAIIPIGTIAIAMAIAIIPIGTAIAVVAVSAAVISTAICTPPNSAVDASNATGC